MTFLFQIETFTFVSVFDAAILEALKMLRADSYLRFIQSDEFEAMIVDKLKLKDKLPPLNRSNSIYDFNIKLLTHPSRCSHFGDFLKKEFSFENLDFYSTVEEFKKLPPNSPEFKQKAKSIYNKFIDTESFWGTTVCISGTIVEQIKSKLENPPQDIFDSAQAAVWKLMKQDSFSRFRFSQFFLKMLTQYDEEILSHLQVEEN